MVEMVGKSIHVLPATIFTNVPAGPLNCQSHNEAGQSGGGCGHPGGDLPRYHSRHPIARRNCLSNYENLGSASDAVCPAGGGSGHPGGDLPRYHCRRHAANAQPPAAITPVITPGGGPCRAPSPRSRTRRRRRQPCCARQRCCPRCPRCRCSAPCPRPQSAPRW